VQDIAEPENLFHLLFHSFSFYLTGTENILNFSLLFFSKNNDFKKSE